MEAAINIYSGVSFIYTVSVKELRKWNKDRNINLSISDLTCLKIYRNRNADILTDTLLPPIFLFQSPLNERKICINDL